MRWIRKWIRDNSCHSEPLSDFCHSEPGAKQRSCHSEPGAKPGEEPAFQPARVTRILITFSLLSLSVLLTAQTPQNLLAAGRVDQALQTLEQQIHTTPTADAYNLLCRAHF